MGKTHRETYVSTFALRHTLLYSKGPVSMKCTVGTDVTDVMQNNLHLVFPLSELSLKISGDTIYTCSSPWYGVTPTWTFWEFGRYSAVGVILFSIKHSQISLDTLPSYVLFGPPIFTMFLPCRLTDFGFFILQSNSIAYLPAFISKTLCGIVPSPCSTDFLPSVPGRVLPNHLILLHPAEL